MTSTPTVRGLEAGIAGFHAVARLPMHTLRRAPEISLDGAWDFQLLPTPDAPVGDTWKTVQVPSLWTMSESADGPHYTNVAMPFDEVPPDVPSRNPTGIYRKDVDLDLPSGRRAILCIGAAEGLLRLSVNGRALGVSSDSHLAAEFDITDACVPGRNRIELTVSKWSAVTFLEDQDHWWQSGISRSVFLYTVPEVRLTDVWADADFDPDTKQGGLRVTAFVAGLAHLVDVDWSVEIEVLGQKLTAPVASRVHAPSLPRGRGARTTRPEPRLPPDFMDLISLNAASAPIPPELRAIPGFFSQTRAPASPPGSAHFTLEQLQVDPWSAESPSLVDLVVRLVSPDGRVADETRTRVGFRRVAVEGRDLLVNGRRILVQGVNRHDFHPVTGRVLSRADLLVELSLLKRHNVNAIRTSHYPNDPDFLELCDEIGFYVIDEADIEAHAFASTIADDPRYVGAFVDRVSRMVQRDRNHPSVIAWSLGNETGYGANHDAAAGWVRRFDPSRPLHYEGAVSTDWHAGHVVTDIVCPMYPAFEALESYSADPRADRPLVLCEYAYSQGNSTGGLAAYWELFETLPGLQGGFIWEFKDHGLDPDGDGRYRYGGDFGDSPNDGAVCLNGVVFPDNTPKPALFEARGIFSPVRIVSGLEEVLAGHVEVRNRQTFTDLSRFRFELQVETRDGPVRAVEIELPEVAAGATVTVAIPTDLRDLVESAAALALTLTVRTGSSSLWAPEGTMIAAHQVVLPHRPAATPHPSGAPALVDGDGAIQHALLVRAPQLCLWRAMTENDHSFALDNRFVRSGFFQLNTQSVNVEKTTDGLIVTTRYATAWDDEVVHVRTIASIAEGDHLLTEQVTLPVDTHDGLRVGMELQLVDGFAEAQWIGLGPWENYSDRCSSALLGRWTDAIENLAVPYIVPQENGGRGEVVELRLSGPAGRVTTTHYVPLQVNVGRHTHDELEAATHWWELPKRTGTIVHLDVAHRGVGTTLLGPDTRPPFRLDGHEYCWQWRLAMQEA